MLADRVMGLLAALIFLPSCGPAAQEPPVAEGTTLLPYLGARQVASCRCTVDLPSGKVEVLPSTRSDVESEPGWNDLSDRTTREGRTYRVFLEADGGKHQFFPSLVRVSVLESDSRTGTPIRSIPVQEFRGTHEDHGVRALSLTSGRLRFHVQFWVNVE